MEDGGCSAECGTVCDAVSCGGAGFIEVGGGVAGGLFGKGEVGSGERMEGVEMRMRLLLIMVLCGMLQGGCVGAAGYAALGTGSVVWDMVLGEAIQVGAREVAERVVPGVVGAVMDGGWGVGSGVPGYGGYGGRRKVEYYSNGRDNLAFVGDWR